MDDNINDTASSNAIIELAKKHAHIMGMAVEELAEAITKALGIVNDSLKNIAKELEDFMSEIDFDILHKFERRKEWRQRQKFIEEMYNTKIKYFKRYKPFRRVYKPP